MGITKKAIKQKRQFQENRGKSRNITGIGGEFIKFVEIGKKDMHHWLRRLDAPVHKQERLDIRNIFFNQTIFDDSNQFPEKTLSASSFSTFKKKLDDWIERHRQEEL